MEPRKCMYCGQPGDNGAHELRPYGPNGQDVCATCVFNGPPERIATARDQLRKRLLSPGTLVLDPEEQVGPRPIGKATSH